MWRGDDTKSRAVGVQKGSPCSTVREDRLDHLDGPWPVVGVHQEARPRFEHGPPRLELPLSRKAARFGAEIAWPRVIRGERPRLQVPGRRSGDGGSHPSEPAQ